MTELKKENKDISEIDLNRKDEPDNEICDMPIMCPKCCNPQSFTYGEFRKMDKIKCKRCGFLYNNPARAGTLNKVSEDIWKTGDC
jgi:hypothetical protein